MSDRRSDLTARLDITSEHADEALWVSLEGELDLSTAPPVEEFISGWLGEGMPDLVLDLGDLEFIDSTGLEVLVKAGRAAELRSQRVIVLGSAAQVRRVFEITGLEELMPLVATRDEARALLAEPDGRPGALAQ
jgi:anti-anti-sigma factor